MFKNIEDLIFGFSDAENYKRRENKELLNHVFTKDKYLDEIAESSTSFLVGDKGTGKTAYAVYYANNAYSNSSASIRYIRETEYQKFMILKEEKHLALSDYASIWKVILLLLLSEQIHSNESDVSFFDRFTKFKTLHASIQEYYLHAFSPEIIHALQFVQESKLAAEIMAKHAKASGELTENITFSESRFQTNLLYIQKNFESAISTLKLNKNQILFVDGIDIRPSKIPYSEYLDCIKGLANAVWELNNDFFPTIKDSPGRLRVVLLIRPDIYASLGLQNQNTKIRDNSVLLNWSTTYRDHRTSKLFLMADRLLSHDQENKQSLEEGDSWDYYFPFDTPTDQFARKNPSSFISFLRFALYRPRDIVTMLTMMQERFLESDNKNRKQFSLDDFDDSVFRRNYADYLLGEVKDQIHFYYSSDDYESFLKFFEFLDGKNRFTYSEYIESFDRQMAFLEKSGQKTPNFMSAPDDFLQFLYELNVICYIEDTDGGNPFIHWCFRDRSYSNIAPKVKSEVRYEIFYGMSKALNTGKKLKKKESKKKK